MSNIFEQFKLYKQHNELLKKAEEIFPTTQIYNNFKDQLDLALKEGDLSQAEFALETFELMQQKETSPLFYDTLNQRLTDPLFCQFSDLIMDITPQYSQAEFTGTPELNAQLADDLNGEPTIVATPPVNSALNPTIPTTNKKVLDIVNGIILNSEVMYTPDGIVTNKNAYTTKTLEEAREKSFKENLQNATSPEEVNAVVDDFTPKDVASDEIVIDETPKALTESEDYKDIDTSTISEESKEMTNAIIEEIRRKSTEEIQGQSAGTMVVAQPTEMGLE